MKVFSLLLFFVFSFNFAQIKVEEGVIVEGNIDSTSVKTAKDPLKASLYSAVLPGLGQWYNGKKIKAPIVLGIVASGIGYTIYLDKRYKDLKTAYIAELNGEEHEYSNIANLDATALGRAQDRARRNRDYSIAITSLLYILNIIDATVDAHLSEFDIDKDLTLKPTILHNPNEYNPKLGIGLSFTF
ncbi:MAG: hypothetical protein H6604_07855 [Flavobacteriales bacterium]|nr:hypothetical protein [Flavobacteriales bacterium]